MKTASRTGRPCTGHTCDCGRPAVVHKWGTAYCCARCHAIETEMYTKGSKWEINIVIDPTDEDTADQTSARSL